MVPITATLQTIALDDLVTGSCRHPPLKSILKNFGEWHYWQKEGGPALIAVRLALFGIWTGVWQLPPRNRRFEPLRCCLVGCRKCIRWDGYTRKLVHDMHYLNPCCAYNFLRHGFCFLVFIVILAEWSLWRPCRGLLTLSQPRITKNMTRYRTTMDSPVSIFGQQAFRFVLWTRHPGRMISQMDTTRCKRSYRSPWRHDICHSC